MAKRVYTATEKTTGRTWSFCQRRIFGRVEFRAALHDGAWSPTLAAAKAAAKVANRFRYDDEPPLVTIRD